jgi:hypothetical protein
MTLKVVERVTDGPDKYVQTLSRLKGRTITDATIYRTERGDLLIEMELEHPTNGVEYFNVSTENTPGIKLTHLIGNDLAIGFDRTFVGK